MVLRITGRPIAKKNSRRLFRAGGRIIVAPSAAYTRFHRSAVSQIVLFGVPGVKGDVYVSYRFVFKGRMWLDFDNAIASINDILTDSGMIEDDRHILCGTFVVEKGGKDWMTEIEITPLTLQP